MVSQRSPFSVLVLVENCMTTYLNFIPGMFNCPCVIAQCLETTVSRQENWALPIAVYVVSGWGAVQPLRAWALDSYVNKSLHFYAWVLLCSLHRHSDRRLELLVLNAVWFFVCFSCHITSGTEKWLTAWVPLRSLCFMRCCSWIANSACHVQVYSFHCKWCPPEPPRAQSA